MAFRTISEGAGELDLPPHVLRFWEAKFPQLKPLKRGGGRRYYRPEDIVLLQRIRHCLYQDGYTIRGVRQLLDGTGEASGQPAVMPTLFPLDPLAAPTSAAAAADEPATSREAPAKPTRRPRQPSPRPDNRAALEEIRRDLTEARALLDDLLRPKA